MEWDYKVEEVVGTPEVGPDPLAHFSAVMTTQPCSGSLAASVRRTCPHSTPLLAHRLGPP